MYKYMYTYMCIYILSSWVAVSWKAIFMGFLAVHDKKDTTEYTQRITNC